MWATRLFFILARRQPVVLCQNETHDIIDSHLIFTCRIRCYMTSHISWFIQTLPRSISKCTCTFSLCFSELHILPSVHINSLQECYQTTFSTDLCVPLPTGSHRRLYVHKQRPWPSQSQPSRQNGELLPGWDTQILLPAVFQWPQPYQLRQVHLQHWGPSSAHMATSRMKDPQAHVHNQTHLSQGHEHIWYPNCHLFFTRNSL